MIRSRFAVCRSARPPLHLWQRLPLTRLAWSGERPIHSSCCCQTNTATAPARLPQLPYRTTWTPPISPVKLNRMKEDQKKKIGIDVNKKMNSSVPTTVTVPAMQYLSFFLYTPIQPTAALLELREELFTVLQELGCRGRIFLASEGINAQMATPVGTLAELEHKIKTIQNGIFKQVEFTVGDIYPSYSEPSIPKSNADANKSTTTPKLQPFHALHIRVRHRLVADGLDDATHAAMNLHDHGQGLTAEQWHKELEQVKNGQAHPETKILDCRNWFESEIGGFEGSIPLGTDLYRQSFQKLDSLLANAKKEDFKEGQPTPTTYIYCTGGIRCVKVGAYLRSKGHPYDIKFIQGGINAYAKLVETKKKAQEPFVSVYKGKNFVFDARIKEGNESVRISEDVLGKCHQCGNSCDTHVNCKNLHCDVLFLQCPTCAAKNEHTCSEECHTVVKKVRAQLMSFSDLPNRPSGQAHYRRRVGLAANRVDYQPLRLHQQRPPPSTPTASASSTFHSWSHSSRSSSIAPAAAVTPISFEKIEPYCLRHSTPASSESIISAISEQTHASMPERANMLSDTLVGSILRSLAVSTVTRSKNPRILELGTFTGYSTAWLLDSLPHDRTGVLISCELKDEYAQMALKHLSNHHNFSKLQLRLGPALETLEEMVTATANTDTTDEKGFDFIYLDANKKSYLSYYEFIFKHNLLNRGGILMIDNTLWKGLVTTSPQDSMTRSIHHFNQHLAQDSHVIVTMLPIRDGITIVQHRL